MRLEAHLITDAILVRVYADSYEHASSVRREVTSSRYVGKYSDREGGIFGFKYPLSPDKCVEMREAWGDALKVHRDLSAWYREASQKRSAQVSVTKQADAELPVLASRYPAFNAWLKGDQRVTARWIANAYRRGGLLADEVGTGKTAGVVAGLIESGVKGGILIVCPKISVKAVWGKEFATHCPDVPVFLARGKRQARQKAIDDFMDSGAHEVAVLVVVAEMLRIKGERVQGRMKEQFGYDYPDLFDTDWNAVVVDESQNIMGSMDVVKGTLNAEGLKQLPLASDALKLAVSATPFGKGGKVESLFGTLHWLWPDEFTSKWGWLGKYFDVTDEEVYVKNGGGAKKSVKRIGGLTDEERMWRELGPRVLRRTMEEVSPEHRGLKNWVEVTCEMTTAQAVQYKKFTDDAELVVDGGIISTVGTLDYLTRCRQFALGVLRKEGGRVTYTGESGKLDRMEMLLERHPDRKIVIASQYNEFLDVVEGRLDKLGYWGEYRGYPSTHPSGAYLRLDGKTSEGKRDAYMNLFQTDPRHRIFLLNSQAGGVSITLDAADIMICLDEMYPPEANTQLFGRIFRRGRAHQVIYYILRSLGTVDEQIGFNVENGAEQQRRLLDGRRGLEYARELAKYKG